MIWWHAYNGVWWLITLVHDMLGEARSCIATSWVEHVYVFDVHVLLIHALVDSSSYIIACHPGCKPDE